MKISFCIPSLNRPEYLIQTIQSICSNEQLSEYFEVCIYNNCSDKSYQIVKDEVGTLSKKYSITYKEGQSRLNIDQSMYEAIRPATGEYLFLIGDDDYLSLDALPEVIDLVRRANFDIAILNANMINEQENTITPLIGYSGKQYTDLYKALPELKKFCTYGNIIVASKHILEDDFKLLIGTSHAYGCFWLSFFRKYEDGINPNIIIPEKSLVNLRVVKKNYDILEVVFKHANIEHQLYYNIIGPKSKKVLEQFEKDFWNKQASVKQLIKFGIAGNDLLKIKTYHPVFFKNNRSIIETARVAVKILMPFKAIIKKIINTIKK